MSRARKRHLVAMLGLFGAVWLARRYRAVIVLAASLAMWVGALWIATG